MVRLTAELGVNWRSLEDAVRMIGLAKDAGATYAKFQVYTEAQIAHLEAAPFLRSIQLDETRVKLLVAEGRRIGLEVFFSVMDPSVVEWVAPHVKRFKIRAQDANNEALITCVTKYLRGDTEVIISVAEQFKYRPSTVGHDHRRWGVPPSATKWLYCISKYPASLSDLRLRKFREDRYDGFSCHIPPPHGALACQAIAAYLARKDLLFEVHVKERGTTPLDDVVSFTFDEFYGLRQSLEALEELYQ